MDIYIYVSHKEKHINLNNIYSDERREEINNVSNYDVKNSKYSVWILLQKAIKEVFGLDPKDIKFIKDSNNMWKCNNFFFSISHSKKFVAVAISTEGVGVDIEEIKNISLKISKHILSEKESIEFNNLKKERQNNYLLEKWTQKEALFKYLNNKIFESKKLDTIINNNILSTISLENKLILSVCSKINKKTKLIFK
ncbi:4'-phosphopantetheinyl transferase family protein [Mycoplasma elephantis]|uniref:4'-phosphopantetheinyl transferase family protein n=1 Tax=Mycoplasma elephantis TaxID=114882 RepID=UPI000487A891|nr:4'-phosphopantetheinyl transferase superfamily protein [Mycoplasma elephantis]